MKYKITYVWHDCFVIESDVSVFVFDYWKDAGQNILGIIDKNKPIYVFVSHHHKDHFNREIFAWASSVKSKITYIISQDTAKISKHLFNKTALYNGRLKVDQSLVNILNEGDIFEDEIIKVYAFGSTDIGCSYLIDHKNNYIFHAGDLNAWIWKDESTLEEIKSAISDFNLKLSPIHKITNEIAIAMFPVDSRLGSDYWEGAKILVHEFDIRHFIPMHFASADDEIELTKRQDDAIKFQVYSNQSCGSYHALTIPYSSILIDL